MRSQKYHKEKEYLSHLQSDPVNKINIMINKIKRCITELGMFLNKSERNIIRKRLIEISKKRPNRRQAKRLEEELTKIFNDLKFKRSHTNSAFDSSGYYGLNDLEHTFGDLDNYYKPVLAKDSFDGNYQMYICRGDKEEALNIYQYLEKIRPYLIALIDEKKSISHKIQLDIAINLTHLIKKDKITFYVKSKNVECHPSDNTEEILNLLIDSRLEYFTDKLMIYRTDSSYVFSSIDGFSIHKIDLRRASSYISTPKWIKTKKAIINPKNKSDNYCFTYATTIAIYHKEIENHLDRISSKLLKYTKKLNWE